jgi:hypothetical protein
MSTRVCGRCASDEDRHGVVLGQGVEIRKARGIRQAQGRDGILLLAAQVQHLAAGRQHDQVGRGLEKLGHERGARLELFEVVEHQEQAPVLQMGL